MSTHAQNPGYDRGDRLRLNVKNKDGLYLGERGFVVDLAKASFGRVPEGPELMNPRPDGLE